MMRYIICIALTCIWVELSAQKPMINIDIGDEIPEIVLSDIYDRSETTANINELSKEKLVIFDFWGTWCGACLGAMPKLDSIANEYVDALEVFTVTKEKKEHVLEFLDKRKRYGYHVHQTPKLFEDTLLATLFPHHYIPHYVWIKEGKVIAITEEVTRESVQLALSEGKTNLRKKADIPTISLHRTGKSLIQYLQNDQDLNMEMVKSYSIFTGHVAGLSSGEARGNMESVGKQRYTKANSSLAWLYRVAYGKSRTFINESTFEVRSIDPYFATNGLRGIRYLDWLKKYGVSYEIVADSDKDIYEKMKSDLKAEFPQFDAYLEKTSDTCLVLEVFDDNPVAEWKVDNDEPARYSRDQDCMLIKNGTIIGLMTSLEGFVLRNVKYPLVNEVDYKGKIDIELCGQLRSVEDVNAAFHKYGLRLTKKIAWFNKLIIKDSK